jgi:hypothetical protein
LIVGIVLIIAPFAISLPSKGSAGQDMLNNFHPIMQPASVKETVSLYNNTFLALKPVAQGGIVAAGEIPSLVTGLGAALHLSLRLSSSWARSTPRSLNSSQAFLNWYRSSRGSLRGFSTTPRSCRR